MPVNIKQFIVWPISIAILVWLLAKLPFATVASMVAQLPIQTLLGACALLALSYGLRAARLQVVLPTVFLRQPKWWLLGLDPRVLKVIFLHNGAINLIPMRAGELTFPWLAERYLQLPLSMGAATLVWMRLQDVMVLSTLALLGMPGLNLFWRGGLFAVGVGAWWLLRRWAASAPQTDTAQVDVTKANACATRSGRWSDKFAMVRSALADPVHERWWAWFFSLANWCVKLVACATVLSALTHLPWLWGVAGALGGELAAVLPVQGPAGLGTYEAGVVLAMRWAGASAGGTSAAGTLAWAALVWHGVGLLTALSFAAVGAGMHFRNVQVRQQAS